jgi:hypothetical protein
MDFIEQLIKKVIFGIIFILVILPISIFWKIFKRKNSSFGIKSNSSWKKIEAWSLNPDEPF